MVLAVPLNFLERIRVFLEIEVNSLVGINRHRNLTLLQEFWERTFIGDFPIRILSFSL